MDHVTKPSTRAKNKYRDKTYDRLETIIPKGKKATLQAHAESKGESLNGFVNRAIDETMARDSAPWRTAPLSPKLRTVKARATKKATPTAPSAAPEVASPDTAPQSGANE